MPTRPIIVFSGLALALFGSLEALEAFRDWPNVTMQGLLFDVLETALLAGAVIATVYFSFEMRELRHEHSTLLSDFARVQAEGERWRETARTHIDGLQRAIREQFESWRLTDSEAEIALLMLKGLSHKEIAQLRNSSEATVRQQATAIYSKSDLASRAALSAYFLDELFTSRGATTNKCYRVR